ncbi:AmmeMemoRadiSam system protein A [Opitutus terrae]|nr:AmmeMemoRadiSam system protein A [Opitutus terrae]
MPHAPVLVPGVGGDRAPQVEATIEAMARIAQAVVDAQPDSLLIISPHSPRRSGAFGIWTTPRLRGSFERFGFHASEVDMPADIALAEQLREEAAARGLHTWRIAHGALDHGATVPLSFLQLAGWQGPTVVLSLSDPGDPQLDRLGEAIAAAARAQRRRLAVIASGDMSHRLMPEAPCGFHPDGPQFDAAFIGLLRNGPPDAIRHLDTELLEHAAEDVVDPTRVALATVGFASEHRTVLSYEGPFGVGYAVAVLFDHAHRPAEPNASCRAGGHAVLSDFRELPRLARRAVEASFAGDADTCLFTGSGELAVPHGVFVTIRSDDGDLRGCRGSPDPGDVIEQTWRHACSSAFHDTRFAPLRIDDLPHVRFSVSVLGEIEPVESLAELDPARYGVLVAAIDGRGALLLPGIEGINSVADQLRCVKQKAGIPLDEWVRIERFTAQAFHEEE